MIDLIIKLHEEEYEEILNGIENAEIAGVGLSNLSIALKNGIPLPKGHGRLIDERLLREDMERIYKHANELVALGFAESCVEYAPTIIEADKEGKNNAEKL